MTEAQIEAQILLKKKELKVAEARFTAADGAYNAAMMIMLLKLRASLERKLTTYSLPSEELEEVIYGYADVEAMIAQAGGEPHGLAH